MKLFKRRFKLPKLLDYPLRSLKYLLLGFFVISIFFQMSEMALKYFLDGEYNIISDVKMYYFFVNISQFALIVIGVLFVLSIFIRNFWCRYLCPYGALLGLFSLLSPTKIKRNPETCTDCSKCSRVCPSFIKVDKGVTVRSDECSTCMACIDVCPVNDTLTLRLAGKKEKISKKNVVYGILLIYFSIVVYAMLSGSWQNDIPKEEYLRLFKQKDKIGHIRSSEDIQKLNREAQKGVKNGE